MEPDTLRELQRNALRAPFRVNMTGGETFEVLHHDFITVSDYHAAIVTEEEGKYRMHMATLVNISTIDMLPASAARGNPMDN